MSLRIVFLIYVFLVLYTIAFWNNKNYRGKEDILWVSKRQWKAIFVMMLPSLLCVCMR